MGVRGLLGYLERNAEKPSSHRLHDCHLVVDASNFVHLMYSKCEFVYEYGGEYDLYVNKLRLLFGKFRRCGIKPLFVFDGANDWDGGKLRQQLQNVEKRVQKSAKLLNGELDQWNRVLPLVTYEVFSHCVREFGFLEATVLTGDADEQTAAIAGCLGCPLLTADSDFYLYPLPGGVVNTHSLDLSNGALASHDAFMVCSLFRQSECRVRPTSCHLRPELAPVWASLVGNDYVSDSEASNARRRLGISTGHGDPVITEAIRWTHSFESADACLAELRQSLNDEELMKRFDASLRHYRLLPDSETLKLDKSGATLVWPGPPPPALTEEYRTRRKLVFFIDALLFQRVILPIGLEHPRLPGVFEATRTLRAAAYALEAARGGALDRIAKVTEYVRVGCKVQEVSVSLAPHKCPDDKDAREDDDVVWRCVLAALDASDDTLSTLLPAGIAASRPLRLALHLLRWQRCTASLQVAELAPDDARDHGQMLVHTGVCVARALLALCLMQNSEADDGADSEERSPKKRKIDAVDLQSHMASRRDTKAGDDQRSEAYLGLLHHFNAFQALLVSLVMFLQAHRTASTQLLPPMHRLLVGRFVHGLGSDLLVRRLLWESQCLPWLADRLRRSSAWAGVTVEGLRRLDDWVVGSVD